MSATEIKLYDFFRKDLNLVDYYTKMYTVQNYKSDIKLDLQKMELQLRIEMKDIKTDMLKWFFAFFVTLVLMILGLYATIIFK